MKYNKIKIRNHQILSFSNIFSYMDSGKDLFWPGCAVLSLGEVITFKTYQLLKEKHKDLVYSTFCCGKPSKFVNESFHEKLKIIIEENLRKNGIVNIYTLCPNCFIELSKFKGVNVVSAWNDINENFPENKLNILKREIFSIHDPCPIYSDIETKKYIREILNKLGVEVLEFEKTSNTHLCCGNKDMMMELNPKKSKEIFNNLEKKMPSKKIVTYCASCKNTFTKNSVYSKHILELLFQTEAKSSWVNRIETVNAIKKENKNA